MRTDDDLKLFFDIVIKKVDKLDIEEPKKPRKRRKPKYSILQYVEGHEKTSNDTEAYYPQTAADHYRLKIALNNQATSLFNNRAASNKRH